jgi:hypothetical protein
VDGLKNQKACVAQVIYSFLAVLGTGYRTKKQIFIFNGFVNIITVSIIIKQSQSVQYLYCLWAGVRTTGSYYDP